MFGLKISNRKANQTTRTFRTLNHIFSLFVLHIEQCLLPFIRKHFLIACSIEKYWLELKKRSKTLRSAKEFHQALETALTIKYVESSR